MPARLQVERYDMKQAMDLDTRASVCLEGLQLRVRSRSGVWHLAR